MPERQKTAEHFGNAHVNAGERLLQGEKICAKEKSVVAAVQGGKPAVIECEKSTRDTGSENQDFMASGET